MLEFGKWNSSSFLKKLFLLDKSARVSTAGVIILATGLLIAMIVKLLDIPLWQFFVVVGAGIVLLIAMVLRTVPMFLLSVAAILSAVVALMDEVIVLSLRLTMLIVAVVFLNAGVLWWILERRKKRREDEHYSEGVIVDIT